MMSSRSGDDLPGAQDVTLFTTKVVGLEAVDGGPAVTMQAAPMALASMDRQAVEGTGLVQVAVVPPIARGRRTKTVTVEEDVRKTGAKTVRKSSRHKGAVENKTVLEKAKMRAAEKNLESGKFTTLDSLSDDHLSTVAADSYVVFTPAAGTLVEAISFIRAKEHVQAALAEVAFRKEQETAAQAAREAAQPASMEGEGALDAGSVEIHAEDARTVGEAMDDRQGCPGGGSPSHPSRTQTPPIHGSSPGRGARARRP
jgi:hypothetical protein